MIERIEDSKKLIRYRVWDSTYVEEDEDGGEYGRDGLDITLYIFKSRYSMNITPRRKDTGQILLVYNDEELDELFAVFEHLKAWREERKNDHAGGS